MSLRLSGNVRNENYVKYKFKSALNYSTASFTGNYISVADLRRQIIQDNRLQNPDYVLQITNQDTKHVYSDSEQTLIPAKTLLTVVRIPKTNESEAPQTSETASLKRKADELYRTGNTETRSDVGAWSTEVNGVGQNYSGNNGQEYPDYGNGYQNYGDGYANYYGDGYANYGDGYVNYGDAYVNYGDGYTNANNAEGYVGYNSDYPSCNQGPSTTNYGTSNLVEIPQSPPEDPYRWVPRKRSASTNEPDPHTEPILTPIPEFDAPPTTSKIPPTYRCYKCNIPGHWIHECPLTKLETMGRRSSGSPGSSTVDLVDISLSPPGDSNISRKRSTSTNESDSCTESGVTSVPESDVGSGRVPSNYRCYRCNIAGHWIRDCPLTRTETGRRPTGIPRSSLVFVEDGSVKGAMLTQGGRYAVRAIDLEAYQTEGHTASSIPPALLTAKMTPLHIFVSRLPPATSEEDLKKILKEKNLAVISVEKLPSIPSYASFRAKIDIGNKAPKEILNPEIWPNYLVVKQYYAHKPTTK